MTTNRPNSIRNADSACCTGHGSQPPLRHSRSRNRLTSPGSASRGRLGRTNRINRSQCRSYQIVNPSFTPSLRSTTA